MKVKNLFQDDMCTQHQCQYPTHTTQLDLLSFFLQDTGEELSEELELYFLLSTCLLREH